MSQPHEDSEQGSSDGEDAAPPPSVRELARHTTTDLHELLGGERTLACLIQGLAGRRLTIELVDNSVVVAQVKAVNIDLT